MIMKSKCEDCVNFCEVKLSVFHSLQFCSVMPVASQQLLQVVSCTKYEKKPMRKKCPKCDFLEVFVFSDLGKIIGQICPRCGQTDVYDDQRWKEIIEKLMIFGL